MKNITLALQDVYLDKIDQLKQMGFTPSRSEFIREATRWFIIEHQKKQNKIQEFFSAGDQNEE